jgi:hypothetical protein
MSNDDSRGLVGDLGAGTKGEQAYRVIGGADGLKARGYKAGWVWVS